MSVHLISFVRAQLSHHATDDEHDECFPLYPRKFTTEKRVHEDAGGKNLEIVHDLKSRRTEVSNDVKHAVVAHKVAERWKGISQETAKGENQRNL